MTKKELQQKIAEAAAAKATELDLSFNGLTTLPPEIAQLTNLKTLSLQSNKLTTLPPEIAQLTNLQTLDLQSNKFTTLPPEIGQLTNLQTLYLSRNGLTTLPPEIGRLTNLKTLFLQSNKFTTLPPEIVQLTNLKTLDLSDNGLTTLPPEIAQLTNLQTLDLSGNGLTTLPPEIVQLTNLQTLYLSRNGLTTLPPEIGRLTNLQLLDLRKNDIEQLPPWITSLGLQLTLDSRFNWEDNPGLFVAKNPIALPPLEVVKQGNAAVDAYFAQIRADGLRLYEAKLLIVGQGKVGKTYLKHRLILDAIDPDTVSTEGIDIDEWTCETDSSDSFRINFWDFGGQEIYHATHQFFLTKRSLYLFAWEARTDADLLTFDYWLNTIKVLSESSPVIVVQCKVDERSKLINQKNWSERFPNIVKFLDVSAIKNTGIEDLRRVIFDEIDKLPHVGDLLPKKWVEIRADLESQSAHFISYQDYKEICKHHGLEEQYIASLSEYFHDLGVFLHFKDNPVLRNTVFLNPEWATNAVYRVTDSKSVVDAWGYFRFNDLSNIWSDKSEFPLDKHIELVELMKSFELCFELPGEREYIIPELLQQNQPEFEWSDENALWFKYKYGFMPAGVITRFIVAMHELIKDDLYWRDGVVLEWEGTVARVIKTDLTEIEVRIAGPDKKTLLGMIRREMNRINNSFSDLDLEELVPCLCSECSGSTEPEFFPYAKLLKAREKRRSTIECRRSFDDVSIEALLGNIEHKTRKGEIKIFLASSGELAEERREIQLLVARENKRLHGEDTFLNMVVWEELNHSFNRDGVQKGFSKAMLECDVVICLFHTKVGQFTREEFDLALAELKAGRKPRFMYAYFNKAPLERDQIHSEGIKQLEGLEKLIEKERQMYGTFKSGAELRNKLKRQLDHVVRALAEPHR